MRVSAWISVVLGVLALPLLVLGLIDPLEGGVPMLAVTALGVIVGLLVAGDAAEAVVDRARRGVERLTPRYTRSGASSFFVPAASRPRGIARRCGTAARRGAIGLLRAVLGYRGGSGRRTG